MTTQTFGDWLLAELEQRHLTQADLARKTKIEPSHISRIISGQRRPGIDALKAIAGILRMSLDDVARIIDDGAPPTPPNNRVRQRRLVYEANIDEHLLVLWHGLPVEVQQAMLELLERLQPRVEPRIIGDAPEEG